MGTENVSKRRHYNRYLQEARRVVRDPGFAELAPEYQHAVWRVHETDYIIEGIMPITTHIAVNDNRKAYGTQPIVRYLMELYYEDVRDKVLVFVKENTDEIIKIPYKTRLDKGYYSPKVAQLLKLAEMEKYQYGILMTLTADPKRYSTPKAVHEALIAMINRLCTSFRKKFKRKPLYLTGWNKEYLATSEFQEETGLIHYHVIFFEATWADIARIRPIYERYMGKGTFFHVEPFHPCWRKTKDGKLYKYTAIHYLLKYLTKASNNFDHKAMLCALGARAFNCSRGLLTIFNSRHRIIQTAKWLYLGAHDAWKMEKCHNFKDFRQIMGLDPGTLGADLAKINQKRHGIPLPNMLKSVGYIMHRLAEGFYSWFRILLRYVNNKTY